MYDLARSEDSAYTNAGKNMFDLIIKNGTVVDGTGSPKFKADVAAATGGEVVIEVFHNSQLGDTTEMLDQARAGANVGTVTDVARLSSFVPSLAIMSAPFLFDTYDQADKFALSDAYLGWGDELKEKAGLVMLASNWNQGARHAQRSVGGREPTVRCVDQLLAGRCPRARRHSSHAP